MLPRMVHPDGISKWRSVEFGGIIHTLAAGNGDIWDDQNIISDEYPVLVTRSAEHKISTSFAGKYGVLQIGPAETDVILLGTTVSYKGVTVPGSFSAVQTLTPMNNAAIILPAKKYIRTDVVAVVDSLPASANENDVYCVASTGACSYWDGSAWQSVGNIIEDIESTFSGNVTITDGTYAGVPARANTINATGIGDYFEPGDGLTLSGTAFPTEKTLIVREVEANKLIFYEDSFTAEKTATPKAAVISRKMPDLDWLCVNENRAWGVKGKTIYASKLGDFKNWNCFDGIASDSYAVDVLSEGEFTGCITFMGYVTCFKETGIYKVYGNRPTNFEIMGSASTGCVNGKTLAIAGETLFYLSREGVMSYSGGYPQLISEQLGDLITGSFDAGAVADGSKYLLWYGGTKEILEYDTRRGMWHKQKIKNIDGDLLFGVRYNSRAGIVTPNGGFWAVQSSGTTEGIDYYVEFADFTEDQSKYPAYGANKKGTSKIQLRMVLGESSRAEITMRFDSSGDWITVKNLQTQNVKKSFYLPIIPRRSDHFRIRIEGWGHFELYSLSRENYKGSAI